MNALYIGLIIVFEPKRDTSLKSDKGQVLVVGMLVSMFKGEIDFLPFSSQDDESVG